MSESMEDQVNHLRNAMIHVSLYIHRLQGKLAGDMGSENLSNALLMEDALVAFERLINSIAIRRDS